MSRRFIRLPEVLSRTGVTRVTLWRMERRGEFPKRVQIGPRAVAWLEHEVDTWMQKRTEAREIEALLA